MNQCREGFDAALKAASLERQRTFRAHGWIYFQLAEKYDYTLSHAELVAIGRECGYKDGWAKYRILEQETDREAFHARKKSKGKPRGSKPKGKTKGWRKNAYDKGRRQRQEQPIPPLPESFSSAWTFVFRGTPLRQPEPNLPPQGISRSVRLLNLPWPFTIEQLKKAYHAKAMETHPDRGGSAAAFNSINKAYEELGIYVKSHKE
jgi:hypothetical protein